MIVHMIGNAHLDPVWLWQWQVGVDEALATFRSAADRLDEYPEFIYTRGEAWLYHWVEKLDPKLFARARRHIESGRWHIVGSQWVQPDCNLPTTEGWHRQLQRGAQYFGDKFGVRPRVGYNVDSFGHPASLPDILHANDMESYVFHRPGAHQVKLPGQAFRWKGTGGAEVVGFRIAQAYVTRTDDLYGQIMLTLEAADHNLGHTMCYYGIGNHGGGPTKGNIEYILENQNFADGVELRFSTPQAFFDAIADKRSTLPVVTQELQRVFPGCYSVMADIKHAQHRGEKRLAQCERFIKKFSKEGAKPEQLQRLNAAWDDLLFTQFHDILAGTSAPLAWPGVRATQGRAQIVGEELILEATRSWARSTLPPVNEQQIVAINASDTIWRGLVEHEPFLDFDLWNDRWLSTLDGTPVPFQRIQPDSCIFLPVRTLFPAAIPAGEAVQLLIKEGPAPEWKVARPPTATPQTLENKRVRVALSERGIPSLTLDGREVLGASGWTLHLRNDPADTWGFLIDRYNEPVETVLGNAQWEVEENGPLRARVRCEGKIGESRFRWTLSLHEDDPEVHWRLQVNWAEHYRILQMPIHLSTPPQRWTDGLPGGHAVREPETQIEKAPVEWPMQSWSHVAHEDYSLALVTPDIYSLSMQNATWQFSLLRATRMAWGGAFPDIYSGRDDMTDQGAQVFEGVLSLAAEPHAVEALHERAQAFLAAPVVFDRYEGMDRPPWGNNPTSPLWTGAEQRARRDGRMMHLVDLGIHDVCAAPVPEPEE